MSCGTVVEFSPDGVVNLLPCERNKRWNLAGPDSEHAALDALPGIKLGVFFSMDGRPNRKAVAVANALRMTFATSDACTGATGTAYFYDDHGPMTAAHWALIRTFVVDKKARGCLENLRLHELESELECQMLDALRKGDMVQLDRLQAERRSLHERHGVPLTTFHKREETQ